MRHDKFLEFNNMNVYVFIRSILSRLQMIETLSPVKAARREKILNAGENLFRQMGVRAVSMEAIAHQAQMSKVTLYGYFRDKDAVFLAVAQRLSLRLETTVFEALTQSGPLPARVIAALLAKQNMVQAVVRSSAFSAELFANSNLIAGTIFADLDAKITAQLGEMLAENAVPKPHDTARLLFAASLGIGEHVKSLHEAKADIEQLVHAFL
jgi:AcrR family transcriptional regulator